MQNGRDVQSFVRGASVLFLLIAVFHLSRLVLQWDATVAGIAVPLWVNGIAFVVMVGLGMLGMRLKV